MKDKNETLEFFIEITVLSLLIVLAGVIFSFWGRSYIPREDVQPAFYNTDGRITIVLDAGHGGRDSGASNGQVFEKDINLTIAKKVGCFLSMYDVDTVLTRTEDVLLAEESSNNKKRDDLINRRKITESYDSPIFISVHMNKFPESKYRGLQVFFSNNHPYSEALALKLQSNVKEFLEPYNDRQIKSGSSNIYLLDRLECPAVLIECGFLSNPDDLKKLTDEEYQNLLAFIIANSIIEYINL